MDALLNTQLGRYRLLERIGEGGMGAVYRALDTRLDCDVAVKLLLPGRESGEVFLKRFQREAKAMARLNHPNLVKVTDYGEEGGKYYLVMPYISGGTLADLAKPMAAENAANYLVPVARALGYAHSQGMIHRDVKPSNILVTQSGEPMLSDFGIARLVGDQEATAITKTGLGVGTPAYMAPEQIKKGYDHRVDIYSLGVVLYELVTGQQPFKGDTPLDTLFKHATEPLVPPSEVLVGILQDVEDIIVRALVKDPDQRYQTMEDFACALLVVIPVIPEVVEVEGQVESVVEEEIETVVKVVETIKETPVDEAETSDELELPAMELQPLLQEPPKKQPRKLKAQSVVAAKKKERPSRIEELLRKRWWQFGLGALVMFGLVWGIEARIPTGDVSVATDIPQNEEQVTVLPATATESIKPTIGETSVAVASLSETAMPSPTPEPRLGVGSTMISKVDGMPIMYVPEGAFMLGSDWELDESPAHEVYLDAYWVDKYEVTNAQYAECVEAGACSAPPDTRYFYNSNYSDHPVVFVNWEDAGNYCSWAGRQLLTEAEWEKAARTGEDTFPPGDIHSGEIINYCDKNCEYAWARVDADDGYARTAPVGSFPLGASPYGANDMVGNVWEWVADFYDEEYYSVSPSENPLGPATGYFRVIRGGSWLNNDGDNRTTNRDASNPEDQKNSIGFRCAIASDDVNMDDYGPIVYGEQQIAESDVTTPTPDAGITAISAKDGMEMVLVAAGTFIMGSDEGALDEQPAHQVYLDAFWIDKFEVTNEQFSACVSAGICTEPSEVAIDLNYPDKPVLLRNWTNAKNYCYWVGRRLPSEAEWEKAARGTDGRIYPWGDSPPDKNLVNFEGFQAGVTDVGSFPEGASPYGVMDMAGNVWEWVSDWYDAGYYSQSPFENPSGPAAGAFHTLRGGAWHDYEDNIRVTNRDFYDPAYTSLSFFGFRCAKDAE